MPSFDRRSKRQRENDDPVARYLGSVQGEVMGIFWKRESATVHGPRSNAAWRNVPSHFVVCTLDRACTPAVQRMMADRVSSSSELESSHSPMLSMPDAVTQTIIKFATEQVR